MASDHEILANLPHRPPFLWVDRIIEQGNGRIITEKDIDPQLDVFQGHFPDYPLLPGVLLCEAIFQTGALLIAKDSEANGLAGGLPVLTRIKSAKFKHEVRPGDIIRMEVELTDREGPAWFLKGRLSVADKTALTVHFACTTKSLSA